MHVWSMLRVVRKEAMAVCRLETDSVEHMLVGAPVEFQVEEADRSGAAGTVELNVCIQAVEVVEESFQRSRSVIPNDENVILETAPKGRAEG